MMTTNQRQSQQKLSLHRHQRQQSAIPALRYKYDKSCLVAPTKYTVFQPNSLQNERRRKKKPIKYEESIDTVNRIQRDNHNEILKITKLMKEYEHDEDKQLYGCERLATFLHHNTGTAIGNKNIRKIIKVVLKCITRYTKNFGIQYNGCLVLEILSSKSDICIPIKYKEMEAIVNIMSKESYGVDIVTDVEYGYMPKLARVDVCKFGCWALAALSVTTQGVTDMIQYNAITAIVGIMRKRRYDINIQRNASIALSNLLAFTSANTAVAQDIRNYWGIEAIIETMRRNETDLVIQLYGCRLMKDFVRNDTKNILFIKKWNGLQVIQKVIREYQNNDDIQHYGSVLLFYDELLSL